MLMKRLFLALAAFGILSTSHASVVLQKDRLIFDAGESSAILEVIGDPDRPFLLQSWVSDTADKEVSSLSVAPPLVVVQPKQAQNIRVLYQGKGLPDDRETRMRLNIQAIAAQKDDAPGQNTLTPSYIQTINLFYRPASLRNLNANDTPQKLTWSIDKQAANQYGLTIKNPTAFNLLISGVFIVDRGETTSKVYGTASNLGFVKPMDQLSFNIFRKDATPFKEKVKRREIWFTTKNDAGFSTAYYATISENGIGSFSLFTPKPKNTPNASSPASDDATSPPAEILEPPQNSNTQALKSPQLLGLL